MKLKGKVAIITGATAGIGKSIAYLFAEEGASTILIARRKERLEQITNEINSNGGDASACIGDVTKQEDIDNVVKLALDKYGKIDIIVNNAGIMDDFVSVKHIDDDLWDKTIDVNLTGPMRLIRAVIPEMIKNNGDNIITISSVGGLIGKISGAAYTASKHGVIGLAKHTAWVYGKHNIRSNVIAPGTVNTEIATTINPGRMDMETYETIDPFVKLSPKLGQSKEIAQIALFLASDDSSFVNGDVIKADGGWLS